MRCQQAISVEWKSEARDNNHKKFHEKGLRTLKFCWSMHRRVRFEENERWSIKICVVIWLLLGKNCPVFFFQKIFGPIDWFWLPFPSEWSLICIHLGTYRWSEKATHLFFNFKKIFWQIFYLLFAECVLLFLYWCFRVIMYE